MGIQVYRDISIDFSKCRYIVMDAKQHDSKSRYVRMTCTNLGKKINLTQEKFSAFIRYKKPDGYGAFNKCVISDGKIIFELTEQMLASVGTSYADLVIIDTLKTDINNDITIINADGNIIENNNSIVSTMSFYINVINKPVDDVEIESTNEFSALNDLLIKATKDYEYIVNTTEEYMNNTKSSAEQALNSAEQSKTYAEKSEEYYQKLVSEKGNPEGIATLDQNGKLPLSQLSAANEIWSQSEPINNVQRADDYWFVEY